MARILVVQHEVGCPPALFGEWLTEAHCRLDVRRCYDEDELPPLRSYDGLLVLGGGMDADDDERYPWLPVTRERILEAARLGVPTLGICLGHQLAALALGGSVGRSPHGPQIGPLPVRWGCEVLLDPLVARIAGDARAVHWNQDVVLTLPPDAEVLAESLRGEIQAARLAATVWGVQFHPEVDEEIVALWAATDQGLLPAVGRTADQVVLSTRAAHDELVAAWRPLARSFATLVRGRAAANGSLWD